MQYAEDHMKVTPSKVWNFLSAVRTWSIPLMIILAGCGDSQTTGAPQVTAATQRTTVISISPVGSGLYRYGRVNLPADQTGMADIAERGTYSHDVVPLLLVNSTDEVTHSLHVTGEAFPGNGRIVYESDEVFLPETVHPGDYAIGYLYFGVRTFPAGTWFDYWDGTEYPGGTTSNIAAPIDRWPLLIKGNSILPTGPILQYVDEPSDAPLTLTCYMATDGLASYTLYEDDGSTQAYRNGAFARTSISCRVDRDAVTVRIDEQHKSYKPHWKEYDIVLHVGGRVLQQRVAVGQGSVTIHL